MSSLSPLLLWWHLVFLTSLPAPFLSRPAVLFLESAWLSRLCGQCSRDLGTT